MADPNKPSPTAQPQNTGLIQAMFGQATAMGGSIEDILQQAMLGMSGRQGLTSQPLTGILPRWFKQTPALVQAVQQKALDPYLPTTDPSSWRVFTGTTPRVKITGSTNANIAENRSQLQGDNTEMVNSVMNQPFLWSEDQVAGAIKKFQDAGVTSVTDFDSMQKAWSGLTQRAGAMYSLSSGQRKVTPWDVLDLYKTEMQKAGTFGSSGSSGQISKVTQTSRSVSTITNGDAWNVLRDTMSRMLGHDPSDEQVRDFLGRMNHLAAKNPTITTSTTSGIGTAHQNTSSHTKAGFDSNDILQNAYKDAQADSDYAEKKVHAEVEAELAANPQAPRRY